MGQNYAEVIGDPIGHSKSPTIHKFWLSKLGIEGDYRPVHLLGTELEAYFASRRNDRYWRGCNVTVPHKQAVIGFTESLSEIAREVGAVNLVTPARGILNGHNSDVDGIIDAVAPAIPAGSRVGRACLIGSGGAALAALASFRRLGIREVGINVRNRQKGRDMLAAAGFAGRVGEIDDAENVTSAGLIVNATILGMAGQAAMPESLLQWLGLAAEKAIVLDMVYAPLETGLLRAARRDRLVAVDGLAMLIGQAASAFEHFFGAPAPREHDAELRALLTS